MNLRVYKLNSEVYKLNLQVYEIYETVMEQSDWSETLKKQKIIIILELTV